LAALAVGPTFAASIVKATYSRDGDAIALMIYTGPDGGPHSDPAQYWALLGKAPESAYDVKIKPDTAGGKIATLKGEIKVTVEIRNKFSMGAVEVKELTLKRDGGDSTKWYVPTKELKRIQALIVGNTSTTDSESAGTPATESADNIPDHWRPYNPRQLKLAPGHKMYRVGASRDLRVDTPDPQWPRSLDLQTMSMTSAVFTAIGTPEEASELCELLIHGAIVPDSKAYERLLAIHTKAGFKQRVRDDQLTFDRVIKRVEGGFTVEFTAFSVPPGMAPTSMVARHQFFVSNDASVKIRNTIYLQGVLTNWQTGPLDTEETQAEEAKARAQVATFVEACYKCCSARLPRIEEEP
jgi:hypothetical protein